MHTTITLNNDLIVPQIGLGVWQIEDGDEVYSAVTAALKAGYRLIDTAAIYGNEAGVGQAISKSGIDRKDIIVTTKLWNADQGKGKTRHAFETSLQKLGLDYIDVYLIHWPMPDKNTFIETYKVMEELYKEGKVKAIGVCNFEVEHLEKLMAETSIVPTINQIELHPEFNQAELRAYCINKDITVESYSPLGSSGAGVLGNDTIVSIANETHKTPAQIVIRWHLQHDLMVIPKSTHIERITENIDVYDFNLTPHQMERIDGLNRDNRVGADPRTAHFE